MTVGVGYEPPPLVWRAWAMPSPDTFSIPPVAHLLERWLEHRAVIVDPFARNSTAGTVRNDLNPSTSAEYHMDAREFLRTLTLRADAVLFDPPYSPRQISEVYQQVGRSCSTEDTQNARLYRECRDLAADILCQGGVAISCGWNSAGFGKERGFTLREVLIIAHGGAHNDTIVTVEINTRTISRAGKVRADARPVGVETSVGQRLPL
jgi:hypothetical protein